MGQNRIYTIILTMITFATLLIVVGIFLFSPQNVVVAENEDDSFDPYVYIRRRPELTGNEELGEEGEEILVLVEPDSNPELDVESSNSQSVTLSTVPLRPLRMEPPVPLIFRQQQVYGQRDISNDDQVSSFTVSANDTIPGGVTYQDRPQRFSGSDISGEEKLFEVSQSKRDTIVFTKAPLEVVSDKQRTAVSIGKATQTINSVAHTPSQDTGQGIRTQDNLMSSNAPYFVSSGKSATNVLSPTIPTAKSDSQKSGTITEYWIQIFASINLQTTLDISDKLQHRGINGKIDTQKKNGQLYYRFRYGPFQVVEEAEKFRDWIRDAGAYRDAYVIQEQNQL